MRLESRHMKSSRYSICRGPSILIISGLPFLFSVIGAPLHGQTIYWTQPDGIYRKSLPAGETETLILQNHQPNARGVAVDTDAGKLYWASGYPHAIERSDLDGSHVETLVEFSSHRPLGIALDTLRGKMYWARGYSSGPGKIQRANLDGSDLEDLFWADSPAPSDVALDVANDKMYWADWSLDIIRRANLDGTNIETLVTSAGPHALALDLVHGKMYWTIFAGSFGTGKVECANLDGTDRTLLYTAENIQPHGITVDPAGGKVYWTDDRAGRKAVYCANLDGSDPGVFVEIANGFVWGIDFDATAGRLYWSNYGHDTIYATAVDTATTVDVFPNEVWFPLTMILDRANDDLYWTDSEAVRRATTSGAAITTLAEPRSHSALAVDVSTDSLYALDYRNFQRATLDGGEVEDLFFLPSLTTFGDWGAIALDLRHGYVFVSFVAYPGWGTIRRAGLDGSDPVDIVVMDDFLDRLGGMSVDVLGEKLYWWVRAWIGRGGLLDRLYRADLDGSNIEMIEEHDAGYTDYTPTVVVAPWEHAIYITNGDASPIQRSDLDLTLFETVLEAEAVGFDLDACIPTEAPPSNATAFFVNCIHGPNEPLPVGCSCADLTGEGLIDLRDVSAFLLSFGR